MVRHYSNISNDKFVAYIERYSDVAMVTIHPRPADDRYGVDFSKTVSQYETLSNGAVKSARRELKKLAEQVPA